MKLRNIPCNPFWSSLALVLAFPLVSVGTSKAHDITGDTRILLEVGFEESEEFLMTSLAGKSTHVEIGLDKSTSHAGGASLRITLRDPGGFEEIHPAVDINLPEPVSSTQIQAISCWVYVPEELAQFFFGRYDARILMNAKKPLWSLPAIQPGWTFLRWELSNLYEHPELESVRLQFGPVLPGFGDGAIHIDQFVLEGIEQIGVTGLEQLQEMAVARSLPWTRRLQSIRRLGDEGGLESIPALFEAVADGATDEGYNPRSADIQAAYINEPPEGSESIRSTAKTALRKIVLRAGKEKQEDLKDLLTAALRSKDGRIRLSAVCLLPLLETSEWVEASLLNTLMDDVYYVRESALEGLETLGVPMRVIVDSLCAELQDKASSRRIPAVRCLSEIGFPASGALDALVPVLRDPHEEMRLRQWCLRAAWWIDERVLGAEDWILGLSLRPGEIHRHLLNRAMDRLQSAGPLAVPALGKALDSPDPEVRARAAVLLRNTGAAGQVTLDKVQSDPEWYVRAAAGQSVPADSAPSSPVTVTRKGNRLVLSNGLIEVVFNRSGQDPGPCEARFPGGPNLIDSEWLYKVLSFKDTKAQNIIERVWFQKIRGVPMSKALEWDSVQTSPDESEIVCRYPGGPDFPLEWEFHYRLRTGDSGFYSYLIVRNVSGEDLSKSTIYNSPNAIGMINQLVAPSWGLYETAILHDHFKWPAMFTDSPDFSLYPDIYQATYRLPDGEVDAKHEGSNYELQSPVAGYAGKNGGIWQILPSLEFSGASWPWSQRSSANHNMFVLELENKYYIPVGIEINKGWEKIYGPIFHYINRGANTEEMWEDAKRRAAREVQDWPYAWIDHAAFHSRGSVTGQLVIADGSPPAGAWALLARPDEDIPPAIRFGEWWRDVGNYHYCAPVRKDGSFELSDVVSGDYELFIWHPEVYGEFRRAGLKVFPGKMLDTGLATLTPVQRGKLLWQLGDPNRTMTEFRNGGNYHQWDTYLRYRDDFPDDMEFRVGQSDPGFDWNYLQPTIVQGEQQPTQARIIFDFNPEITGTPLLTIVAGGRGVRMVVLVNGKRVGNLDIVDVGLQHIRTAPNGELTVHEYPFGRSLLVPGENTVTLSFFGKGVSTDEAKQWHYQGWMNYIAYDFIRLEMVPTDPQPNLDL